MLVDMSHMEVDLIDVVQIRIMQLDVLQVDVLVVVFFCDELKI